MYVVYKGCFCCNCHKTKEGINRNAMILDVYKTKVGEDRARYSSYTSENGKHGGTGEEDDDDNHTC